MSSSKKRRTRNLVIVGLIVVLIIAGFFAWRVLRSGSSGEITYKTQAVEKMTLTSSVSGVGNISLSSTATVNPSISGTVSGLAVKVGDTVKQGQFLFTVVNDQLDLDVVNAQNSYNNAVAGVERAQLSVLQAEQSLKNLKKQRADQATSTTATVPSITTSSTHPPTTVTPSTLPATTTTTPGTTPTLPPPTTTTTVDPFGAQSQGAVFTAAAATQATQTAGQTTVSTITALDIDVAEAQVTSAELSVTSAQSQVESASLSLQQAKDTAAKRQVVASMDGVVTQVNVQDGDSLSSTGSSQGGSSSVKVGQKATLTFDALPDLTLTGKVTGIDNSGTVNQGVVSYNVTLVPDSTAPSVKGGMTVTADIITEVRADVLAVPNSAVKTSTSGSYVQILQNGAPVDQTVEVGLSTDSYTEITSGLAEAQEVITQTINPNASTTTTIRRNQGGGGTIIQGGGDLPGGGLPGF
jgi:multidrug efflux pump subunit AcrA (membrane-fusion protein)